MPPVRPDVRAFLDMLNSQPGPRLHELDVATARQQFRMMTQLVERPRGDLARVEELTIPGDGGHTIPSRLYANSTAGEPAPLLLFYHGGGWTIGDLETHDSLCAEIARTLGITVVAVDYRMGPEAPFPAAVHDAIAAARWAAGSPREIGHAVTGLVVAGDSAGGNLAAVVAQELSGTLAVPFLAQWLIYPGVDMTDQGGSMQEFAEGYLLSRDGMEWFGANYAADPAHHHASPAIAADDRFASLPPALVFTAGLDPLRDQGRAYAARLVRHGVPTRFREAAGQIHGSANLRGMIPSAHADLLACLADLKAMIAESSADATMRQAAGVAQAAE